MITANEREVLLSEMKKLLGTYDYNYSTAVLNDIIDEWASQKAPLIELFKKHPNYIEGKFMIAFDQDYERKIDMTTVNNFKTWLYNDVVSNATYINVVLDTLKAGHQYYAGLPYWVYIYLITNRPIGRTIDAQMAADLNNDMPQIHAHTGQKTTRVVNKICKILGYDKHPEYNREFAKFADALSQIIIRRHTILSLNPLDYLTMSFGNSWASCHTIDKKNYRNMPNHYEGQYSSGTMSYMLDPSSMVLYTVDSDYEGNEYYTQPKINRQMFHYGEDKLVQGRLYPQSNDGNNDIYTPYRNLVQEIMATILNVPNLWSLSKGGSNISDYVHTKGTHYTDYTCYNSCTLSKIKDSCNENMFTIGARPICISCGQRHSIADNINHCAAGMCCSYCGCSIHEDDAVWVDDEPYCDDCVGYCSCCESYHRSDERYIPSEGRYVCEYCLEEHYTYCPDCGEYYRNEEMTYIRSTGEYVCENCLDRYYTRCEKCEEWFPNNSVYELDYDWYCERCRDEIMEERENEDE